MSFLELLIVLAIIGLIAAFAVPRLLRARAAADESSAIASMRAILTAENLFQKSCGHDGYASSFPALATPPPGSATAFISAEFSSGATLQKAGYLYNLVPAPGAGDGPLDCLGRATVTGFYVSAVPLTFSVSGARSFAADGAQTIWQEPAATAPTLPFGPPALPLQ